MFDSGVSFAALDVAVRGRHVDVADVAHVVGASAADGGLPLHEVLDHVERAHCGQDPDFAVVRAAAVGWAERVMERRFGDSCEDPLTSLASPAHVRLRLEEIYRGASRDDLPATQSHVLVVAELPPLVPPHRLEDALRALEVSEVLRTVFDGDETVGQLAARRFVVVARRCHADELAVHLVSRLLAKAFPGPPAPRLWVEQLPSSADNLGWMLGQLSV